MKNGSDENNPEAWRLGKGRLEKVIYEAWNTVDESVFRVEVLKLRAKMRRAIAGNGGYIHC
jgi:hypothetical protein